MMRTPQAGRRPETLASALARTVPSPATISASADAEAHRRAELAADFVLRRARPTKESERRRYSVSEHVRRLLVTSLGCEVFSTGSVPLKTYLPEGDIDLTVLGSASPDSNLINDVRCLLESEEHNCDVEFEVKDVQHINAEVQLIKCLIQNIVVDISFNQTNGLSTLCFLELVDRHIGKDHLFKRSIILIKAWCFYESRILGAHHGLLSTYALETLVLYIFNVHHKSLDGPLTVLYWFLEYFSKFDWDNYGISLYGPVAFRPLPNHRVQLVLVDSNNLLFKKEDALKGSLEQFVSPFYCGTANFGFQQKFMNIVDPINESNNLGRSVSKASFHRIRSAFAFGAQKLGQVLMSSADMIMDGVFEFFKVTLDRNSMGRRDDLGDLNIANSETHFFSCPPGEVCKTLKEGIFNLKIHACEKEVNQTRHVNILEGGERNVSIGGQLCAYNALGKHHDLSTISSSRIFRKEGTENSLSAFVDAKPYVSEKNGAHRVVLSYSTNGMDEVKKSLNHCSEEVPRSTGIGCYREARSHSQPDKKALQCCSSKKCMSEFSSIHMESATTPSVLNRSSSGSLPQSFVAKLSLVPGLSQRHLDFTCAMHINGSLNSKWPFGCPEESELSDLTGDLDSHFRILRQVQYHLEYMFEYFMGALNKLSTVDTGATGPPTGQPYTPPSEIDSTLLSHASLNEQEDKTNLSHEDRWSALCLRHSSEPDRTNGQFIWLSSSSSQSSTSSSNDTDMNRCSLSCSHPNFKSENGLHSQGTRTYISKEKRHYDCVDYRGSGAAIERDLPNEPSKVENTLHGHGELKKNFPKTSESHGLLGNPAKCSPRSTNLHKALPSQNPEGSVTSITPLKAQSCSKQSDGKITSVSRTAWRPIPQGYSVQRFGTAKSHLGTAVQACDRSGAQSCSNKEKNVVVNREVHCSQDDSARPSVDVKGTVRISSPHINADKCLSGTVAERNNLCGSAHSNGVVSNLSKVREVHYSQDDYARPSVVKGTVRISSPHINADKCLSGTVAERNNLCGSAHSNGVVSNLSKVGTVYLSRRNCAIQGKTLLAHDNRPLQPMQEALVDEGLKEIEFGSLGPLSSLSQKLKDSLVCSAQRRQTNTNAYVLRNEREFPSIQQMKVSREGRGH